MYKFMRYPIGMASTPVCNPRVVQYMVRPMGVLQGETDGLTLTQTLTPDLVPCHGVFYGGSIMVSIMRQSVRVTKTQPAINRGVHHESIH